MTKKEGETGRKVVWAMAVQHPRLSCRKSLFRSSPRVKGKKTSVVRWVGADFGVMQQVWSFAPSLSFQSDREFLHRQVGNNKEESQMPSGDKGQSRWGDHDRRGGGKVGGCERQVVSRRSIKNGCRVG